MIVSYDGTDFCGWQKQKKHKHASEKPNVQETIEIALSKLFKTEVGLNASGRTDAGVHALGQVCHFDIEKPLPKDLCWALKAFLPSSIAARAAWIAPDDFHSTLSATHKTYRYWIWNSPRPTALLTRYTHWVRSPLDLDYLNEQAKYLEKEQDFKSFQSAGTEVAHTIRQVLRAQWRQRKGAIVEFEITGTGFLKQMVRNIVGTQLDYVLKGEPKDKLEQVLAQKDRTKAGPTAPPQGLYLCRVYYPKDLDNKCRQI